MNSYGYLFWAYNVIWIGLAAYLVFLLVRLGKVVRRLDRVERRVAQLSSEMPPSCGMKSSSS